ncbi:MAG: aspartate-semialdehyde dehydrogenase [Bacteroidota bacterium]
MTAKVKPVDVAVVGATGLVGRTMIRVLEERSFPVRRLHAFASSRSQGSEVTFRGEPVAVETLTQESLKASGASIALFSAGGNTSREFAPGAASNGIVVIDNSSAFRMDPEVPLVVPEVNPDAIASHHGTIANPNCSTIQLVVPLKPLHDRYRVRRIVVATYQSVTGAGLRAYNQLMDEVRGAEVRERKFKHPIAFNCIPQIDEFEEDGYTREEHKMVNETKKILADASIKVNATCVRVPVVGGHSEAATVEFAQSITPDEARTVLSDAPGVVLMDDPAAGIYPMPIFSQDRDEVFVGRLREDTTAPNSITMWIVADNIRKGAATNAVQIAERLVS